MNAQVPEQFKRFISATPRAEFVMTNQPLVDWLLSINTHNRGAKPHIVTKYRRMIEDGRFYPVSQGVGILSNGTLSNGQHRLLAIRAAGYPQVQMLVAYGLPPESQQAEDAGTIRTMRDRIKLALGVALNPTMASACSMIAKLESGQTNFKGETVLDDMSEVVEKYGDALSEVPIPSKVAGLSAGFAAPCIIAAQYGHLEEVMAFIDGYRTLSNLSDDSPILKLHKTYIAQLRKKKDATNFFLATSKALLSFINGTEMKMLKNATGNVQELFAALKS